MSISEQYPSINWTEAHALMTTMGGLEVVKDNDPQGMPQKLHLWTTEDFQLYEIDFSTITEDIIMDRSKGEILAKLLVLLQTFWFATQCIARVAQGLAVTALELTTLGHIAFVGIIYFFWWKKPLDVRYPIVLHAKRREFHDGASDIRKPSTLNGRHRLPWRIRFGNRVPAFGYLEITGRITVSDLLVLTCFSVLSGSFGVIHCLGWNSYFPSHVEQIFWRVAALTVTVLAVISIFMIAFEAFRVQSMPANLQPTIAFIYVLAFFLYICARISLIALAFLALRDLPLTAYQTPSWTNFLPHL